MNSIFERTELMIGKDKVEIIKGKKIALFGLGGVGSYCLEALVRTGVESLLICDDDKISLSNINRQLYALHSTVGKKKVDVAKERILDINPNCKVEVRAQFFSADTESEFDFHGYDYVIDCIDTVTAKLILIEKAKREGAKIISCMGTGNKLKGEFEIADISATSVCPLARVMRFELKRRGIKDVEVLYSDELPLNCDEKVFADGRNIPGSIAFSPAIAGLTIAGHVIRRLIKSDK